MTRSQAGSPIPQVPKSIIAERRPSLTRRFPTATSPWNQTGGESQTLVVAVSHMLRQCSVSCPRRRAGARARPGRHRCTRSDVNRGRTSVGRRPCPRRRGGTSMCGEGRRDRWRVGRGRARSTRRPCRRPANGGRTTETDSPGRALRAPRPMERRRGVFRRGSRALCSPSGRPQHRPPHGEAGRTGRHPDETSCCPSLDVPPRERACSPSGGTAPRRAQPPRAHRYRPVDSPLDAPRRKARTHPVDRESRPRGDRLRSR